jgi:hypothetical protein
LKNENNTIAASFSLWGCHKGKSISNQIQKAMKKLIVSAGLILGFAFMTLSLSAQTSSSTVDTKKTQDQQAVQKTSTTHESNVKDGKCKTYADANKDGVCDNCGSHPATCKTDGSKDKSCCAGSTQMKCSGAGAGSNCGKAAESCKMNGTTQPQKK